MDFSGLDTDRLIVNSRTLDYTHQISVAPQYREFLNFFSRKEKIGHNDFVVGAHMLYGRMPTMLRMNMTYIDMVLDLIERVRNGGDADLDGLSMVKATLNNSMVGTSKLLHFLDPERFAIWDSRIFRYIPRSGKQTGIGRARNYLDYLSRIRYITREDDFSIVHDYVQKEMQTVHSVMRTAEIVMFEMDRSQQVRAI